MKIIQLVVVIGTLTLCSACTVRATCYKYFPDNLPRGGKTEVIFCIKALSLNDSLLDEFAVPDFLDEELLHQKEFYDNLKAQPALLEQWLGKIETSVFRTHDKADSLQAENFREATLSMLQSRIPKDSSYQEIFQRLVQIIRASRVRIRTIVTNVNNEEAERIIEYLNGLWNLRGESASTNIVPRLLRYLMSNPTTFFEKMSCDTSLYSDFINFQCGTHFEASDSAEVIELIKERHEILQSLDRSHIPKVYEQMRNRLRKALQEAKPELDE